MAVWHCVTNADGLILGVYGEALLLEAREYGREVWLKTGGCAGVYIHSGEYGDGARPSVGQSMSMRGNFEEAQK